MTEDDEPSYSPLDSIWGTVFHLIMVTISLTIVFAVSGSLLFLSVNRQANNALMMTPLKGWVTFIIGGIGGVVAVLRLYFGKRGNVI